MPVIHWTEIELFHNIRKFTKESPDCLNGSNTVVYRAKTKLHGVNAGIQIYKDGRVIPQSRTVELTPGNDPTGFARWVMENQEAWKKCFGDDVVVYGEWCGPGIQKSDVAVSSIPRKSFAVFAIRYIGEEEDTLLVTPGSIQANIINVPDTYVIPWYGEPVAINWAASDEELSGVTELLNRWVHDVEKCDPWVEANFGIRGTGEGLVFYPTSESHRGYKNFVNLVFKAKGEQHKNIKTAAPAQVNAEVAASIAQFVDMVLTPARLEQGASTVAPIGGYDMKLMGKFLAWVTADVQKETKAEMDASHLDWKQVAKPIGDKARAWYMAKAR